MTAKSLGLLLIPFAGAAGWFALGIDSIVREGPRDERDALFLIPWVLSAGAYALAHVVQRARATVIARRGFYIVAGSMAVAMAGQLGIIFDVTPLKAFAAVGLLGWVVGMALFGWGAIRTGVFPRYVGVGLMASEFGAIALGVALSPIAGLHNTGSYSGGIANGIVVLLIGVALARMAVSQPGEPGDSRVAGRRPRPFDTA